LRIIRGDFIPVYVSHGVGIKMIKAKNSLT
jgi:hypothetical protein